MIFTTLASAGSPPTAVVFEPGYRSEYYNPSQPRILFGKLVNGALRVPVVGGSVDHIDLPLHQNSKVLKENSTRAQFAADYTVKRFGPTSQMTNSQIRARTQTRIDSSVIVIDENGKTELMARTISKGPGEPKATVPYSVLDIRQNGSIAASPPQSWASRMWENASPERAGGLVDALKNTTVRVQRSYKICRGLYDRWFGPLQELQAFILPEMNIPQKNPQIVGWDKFYDYVANLVGNPINNCLANENSSGRLALDNAAKLSQQFKDDLIKNKILPEKNAQIPPEKIASVDICARTCFGEMGLSDCYTDGDDFYPYHLKAVVGTLSNREDMIQSRTAGWFHTAAYIPSRDSYQFDKTPNIVFLQEDKMIEASLLASQYNNWKCVQSRDSSGKIWENCGALRKSFCPTPNRNPLHEEYQADPQKFMKEHPELEGVLPPAFVAESESEDRAFRMCAKYCAQNTFNPETFKSQLAKCKFDRMSFTSGSAPELAGCYPLDEGFRGSYKLKNGKVVQVTKNRRSVSVPRDGRGCEKLNNIQCTRFWSNKVVIKSSDGKEVKVSGCLE